MIEGMREREAENWLTARRIAESSLIEMSILMPEMRAAPAGELQEVLERLLRTFALGRCYRLASAAAELGARQVIGFWRKSDPDAPIVHAAVVDPASSLACDVLGVRLIVAIREELEQAVGPIKLSILERMAPDEYEPGERECLALIVRGLPWFGGVAIPFEQWRDAVIRYQGFKEPGEA